MVNLLKVSKKETNYIRNYKIRNSILINKLKIAIRNKFKFIKHIKYQNKIIIIKKN